MFGKRVKWIGVLGYSSWIQTQNPCLQPGWHESHARLLTLLQNRAWRSGHLTFLLSLLRITIHLISVKIMNHLSAGRYFFTGRLRWWRKGQWMFGKRVKWIGGSFQIGGTALARSNKPPHCQLLWSQMGQGRWWLTCQPTIWPKFTCPLQFHQAGTPE